mgnify:CR=1 FL=1
MRDIKRSQFGRGAGVDMRKYQYPRRPRRYWVKGKGIDCVTENAVIAFMVTLYILAAIWIVRNVPIDI